jgi:manganese transport protein
VIVVALLMIHGRSFRTTEWLIASCVLFIALCYLVQLGMALPEPVQVLKGLVPSLPRDAGVRTEALWLAAGILGATVMPHALFLHSSLTQGRIPTDNPGEKRRLHALQLLDVTIALSLAGLVNAAMLLTAAAAFHFQGRADVAGIETAYEALSGALGPFARTAFGLALLASGLSSSVVGTMAGQVIMQGFLRRSVSIWVRRLVTMVPALLVIWAGLDPTQCLVWSQVVLSFGLPFAVVPLIWFTASRGFMGRELVNRPLTTILAVVAAILILSLNALLVFGMLTSPRGG